MTEASNPLVWFLLNRLDEDERIARVVASESPTDDTQFCNWMTSFAVDPDRLIVAVDYQRVLAEITAKRRIIARYQEVENDTSEAYTAAEDYMETVLRELASAHADHPDHEYEWKD